MGANIRRVAGLCASLVLSGSILSGLRMQPGHWAGAYACWGAENREAAVRFLVGAYPKVHGGKKA